MLFVIRDYRHVKLRFYYKLSFLRVAERLCHSISELADSVLQAVFNACGCSWVGLLIFMTKTNEFKLEGNS